MSDPKLTFEPPKVADWFAEIMRLSRESGKEDPIRDKVYTWLTDPRHGIGLSPKNVFYDKTATEPGKRVIRAYRPGTRGTRPIVLQAHLDMVVVTEPPGKDPFPLQPYYEDEKKRWLRAKGAKDDVLSTLGADDGIGIATALALLQEADLKDYPIECLFTVQEETNMGGAKYFDTSLLKGRTYINLDDEKAGTITYGSAGGFKTTYEGPIQREKMSPAPAFVKIVLGGLRGGHSGVEIANGRPSALKLLVEGLCLADKRLNDYTLPEGTPPESFDFRLVDLKRTDEIKSNSIPTAATAVLAVGAADVAPLIQSFKRWLKALQTVYGASEPKLRIDLTPLATVPPENPLTAAATDNLLCFLRLVPQGVIGLIPGYSPAVVETSSNLYKVVLGSAAMKVETSSRTSNPALLGTEKDHDKTPLNVMLRSLGEIYGLKVTTGLDWYPAWPPNKDSHLLAKAKEIYKQVYPNPQISVIHAGLECGWIVSRYKDMDCIAIGPTIESPHTTGERLDTTSVKGFYEGVKKLMLALFKEHKPAAEAPAQTEEEVLAEV